MQPWLLKTRMEGLMEEVVWQVKNELMWIAIMTLS